jgi:GNAT superfamily N-acetyltransferase
VIVRTATPEDAEAMARVHGASYETAYGLTDDFDRRLGIYREHVFSNAEVRPLLAEEDGRVVGIATVGAEELYAIYVHPDRWGGGVGQALLDRAHVALAETCDEARLTVLAANLRARRFYERNGWELVERLTEPHFGGVPTDVCRYRRTFSSSRS